MNVDIVLINRLKRLSIKIANLQLNTSGLQSNQQNKLSDQFEFTKK
ncbi:hypothetical protein QFZ20_002380 [Flavobacterium sp. W4I14]|nr:hypothetical protein [Flavobacterium sp. W4I14]